MMRDLDWIYAVRDRVVQHWGTDCQPRGPLLGETGPKVCKRGHVGAPRSKNGTCVECNRERKRRAYVASNERMG